MKFKQTIDNNSVSLSAFSRVSRELRDMLIGKLTVEMFLESEGLSSFFSFLSYINIL